MTGATPAAPSTPATSATPAAPLRAIIEELVRGGVRDVVVCPGSRSTPMALALRVEPALRVWMHLDERAGAFFALGAAKASRRPTAILTTSGTAVAELLPAIVEARHGRVPLIALTADRPPELQDRGAPQTIDQVHLYGRFAKWFAELPVPQDATGLEGHVRSVVARAVATSMTVPMGPVQLNLPFRDPLVPEGALGVATAPADARGRSGGQDGPGVVTGNRALPGPELDRLADRVSAAERGHIVCGPMDAPGFPDGLVRLAGLAGFPVIADGLSNVRAGGHDRSTVMAHHDALIRTPELVAAHMPDLVLRFGATPTSRLLVDTIAGWSPTQIVVDDGGWSETTLLPVTMVQADASAVVEGLAARLEGRGHQAPRAWLEGWRAADAAAGAAVEAWLASLEEPFEGAIPDVLGRVLPDGALLFAGNGMPVWDLDAYLGSRPGAIRCLGNRGANGIDGLVSTALGMAAAGDGPVVAVVGDLSFLHDLSALASARRHALDATIVLVDNDGGGIFSFLPQAAADRPEVGLPEHYEELFGTPHGMAFGPLVAALGAHHQLVAVQDLGEAVRGSIDRPGIDVLQLRTERDRNVALHRDATAVASAAIRAVLERSGRPA